MLSAVPAISPIGRLSAINTNEILRDLRDQGLAKNPSISTLVRCGHLAVRRTGNLSDCPPLLHSKSLLLGSVVACTHHTLKRRSARGCLVLRLCLYGSTAGHHRRGCGPSSHANHEGRLAGSFVRRHASPLDSNNKFKGTLSPRKS